MYNEDVNAIYPLFLNTTIIEWKNKRLFFFMIMPILFKCKMAQLTAEKNVHNNTYTTIMVFEKKLLHLEGSAVSR